MQINNSKENQNLIAQAQQALQYAYAPYSKFKVGAAVLTAEGEIYTGCNIENASYGASNCAERTAIFKAVSHGHTCIIKIAVVSAANKFTPPCGICRQVMAEFMEADAKIVLESGQDLCEYTLAELLPSSFNQSNL